MSGQKRVGSRVISEEPRLQVLAAPTAESPSARLLSTRLVRTVDNYEETTKVRRALEKECGASVVGGLGLAALLVGSGMQNKGYPEYEALPIVCLGVAGLGLAVGTALGLDWPVTSIARKVDTSTAMKPVSIQVLDGEHVIAGLDPDYNGIAVFSVQDHLDYFQDTLRDWTLTARMPEPDTLLRGFTLPSGAVIQARRDLKAEQARQAEQERERLKAEAAAREAERQQREQAAATLDNIVASLNSSDIADLDTRFRYADAGFQYMVASGNLSKALHINSYGEFLDLPLRSQVWALRELARTSCGSGHLQASLFLQELLSMPAYLAEKILH